MWKCPKCGREFKKINQSHYCGKPKFVEDYINAQDEEKRQDLYKIEEIIKNTIPEAQERISWSMPTYWRGVNIIHFAANKNGIGLYPGTEAINSFKDELSSYKTTKSSVEIPYGHIDEDLIRRITIFCWKEILFL